MLTPQTIRGEPARPKSQRTIAYYRENDSSDGEEAQAETKGKAPREAAASLAVATGRRSSGASASGGGAGSTPVLTSPRLLSKMSLVEDHRLLTLELQEAGNQSNVLATTALCAAPTAIGQ